MGPAYEGLEASGAEAPGDARLPGEGEPWFPRISQVLFAPRARPCLHRGLGSAAK
jgi:hypothetical protein